MPSYDGNVWQRPYSQNEWKVLYYFWITVAQMIDMFWLTKKALYDEQQDML